MANPDENASLLGLKSKNKTQIYLKTLLSLSVLYLLESLFYDVDINNNSLEHLSPGLIWFESFKKNLLRIFFLILLGQLFISASYMPFSSTEATP